MRLERTGAGPCGSSPCKGLASDRAAQGWVRPNRADVGVGVGSAAWKARQEVWSKVLGA